MSIILGYVPNERGEAAYAKALSLAAELGQELVIMNTSARHSHVDPMLATESTLDDLVHRATAAGVPTRAEHNTDMDGPDALIEASHAADADMLVIGIRKRSQVGKLLLGSDAQRILLEASCPVVAVKAH
ncbi:universal stress protein [Kocuria dechangensis]|uniref:Universal stress protein n=1 Tax=Kocuria dechangensis TaxID=1176249 RepID=A0A917M014_9MICC|nr:universal stress protein [Kocuria dechangensis]GGG68549.1 universal stress protein [Kocuria dechangensis]